MKTAKLAAVSLAAVALAGCGLENFFSNVGHQAYERPASRVVGALGGNSRLTGADPGGLNALDGDGNVLEPFQTGGTPAASASACTSGVQNSPPDTSQCAKYEVRLPSTGYSMIRVQAQAGELLLRGIVPTAPEETTITQDIDPRAVTETLVMEARLSALGLKFKQLTPAGYQGARDAIASQFTVPGPTQDLLHMVERLMDAAVASAGSQAALFFVPKLDASYVVKESPVDVNFLARTQVDYTGDGAVDLDTTAFDTALAAAAQVYLPEGCPSTTKKRLVFSVDFNAGALDGNCATVDRFKWAKDKPGKSMFFVGWIHKDSDIAASDRPDIHNMLGASVPNQVAMYDDGTHGDEVAGDNIWTVAFDVDVDPQKVLRIGYKYTWGTRGAVWTGSEEWPGNSRILEVVDVNGDGFVYRRDVFQDEATNKDKSNLNLNSIGQISWNTELHGPDCGPEAHERPFQPHTACVCGTSWFKPTALGAITEPAPIAVPQKCP